jgi:predicted nucleic acid-binding protein
MLYLDTSSLLKLFFNEPESAAVRGSLETEDEVVITTLTELETETQLRAALLGGRVTKSRHRKVCAAFESTLAMAPFIVKSLPGSIFTTALRIHRDHPDLHCRSLDRLQVAAMEELGIRRLMCHDARLCSVARVLGHEVVTPV